MKKIKARLVRAVAVFVLAPWAAAKADGLERAPVKDSTEHNIQNSASGGLLAVTSAFQENRNEDALQLLQSLAQEGDAQAQFLLGYVYESGTIVTADDAVAESWYCEAAHQGHRDAQFQLGLLYLSVDNEEAESWLEKAAAQNHPHAQFVISDLMAGEYADEC